MSEPQATRPPPLRSLSGIKPTGMPHWGNYFGMIQPALRLAEEGTGLYFIADYHALTTVRDAQRLRDDSYGIAATLLACGLDPKSTTLWRQSDVPEVQELTWILSCVTGFGLIERAHAFKDARANGRDVGFGLVAYPVLMAADILMFDSDVVPVGKDQVQHLEFARDMAGYFNVQFLGSSCHDSEGAWDGRGLKFPKPVVQKAGAVVPGLDGRKMSKSYDNHIPMFASKKDLKKRVMAIVTDSLALEEPKDPVGCTVYELYQLFASEAQVAEMAAKLRAGGYGYGHAKLDLLAAAEDTFGVLRSRYDAWMADRDALEAVLQEGALRARSIAAPVMARVREAVGLPARPMGG